MELIEAILARNATQPIIPQSGNFADHVEAFQRKYDSIPVLEKPYRAQQAAKVDIFLLLSLAMRDFPGMRMPTQEGSRVARRFSES